MPVTAKLSLKFYEKLGEEVANELVDWFNTLDATYRSDLRELNDLNFARFDAKLEQRLAELRGEFRATLAVEGEAVRREIRDQAVQMAGLEKRLVREIERTRSSVIKWSFGFYAGTALSVLGLKLLF